MQCANIGTITIHLASPTRVMIATRPVRVFLKCRELVLEL
jgi:hypothetical protein